MTILLNRTDTPELKAAYQELDSALVSEAVLRQDYRKAAYQLERVESEQLEAAERTWQAMATIRQLEGS